jgi:hypothetical protein
MNTETNRWYLSTPEHLLPKSAWKVSEKLRIPSGTSTPITMEESISGLWTPIQPRFGTTLPEPSTPKKDKGKSKDIFTQPIEEPTERRNPPRAAREKPAPKLQTGEFIPTDKAVGDTPQGSLHSMLYAAISTNMVPNTFKQAQASPDASQWECAMQEEINSLHERNIWKLVPRLKSQDTIRGKWVFTIKEDGQYKARYVAKGYSQIQGIDYNETFSPVARYETIRTLLALATIEDWEINTMDVKTAYLYGCLDHDI